MFLCVCFFCVFRGLEFSIRWSKIVHNQLQQYSATTTTTNPSANSWVVAHFCPLTNLSDINMLNAQTELQKTTFLCLTTRFNQFKQFSLQNCWSEESASHLSALDERSPRQSVHKFWNGAKHSPCSKCSGSIITVFDLTPRNYDLRPCWSEISVTSRPISKCDEGTPSF